MKFAKRIDLLEDQSLLDAFELPETKGGISFSAGFPSAETYPTKEIGDSFKRVVDEQGEKALSYCSTSGYAPLREKLSKRMKEKLSLNYGPEEIIITGGSQQGLDMSGMLFVNEGDVVLFEEPSYLGAVNALRAHEAHLVSVPTDDEGMVVQQLKEKLEEYKDQVKMVYVNPDHQNPTGRSWSQKRRIEFIELMNTYDIPILEDAAYGELSFNGELEKPLAYYDKTGQVIYIGTFSKIFCPGLRVAWLCAKRPIMEKYLILKNAADLSSSTISQMQMDDYLSQYDIDKHIEEISKLYGARCQAMVRAIEKNFPQELKYTKPTGGLFVWVTLPEDKDAKELLKLAGERKISFIPGAGFYPGGRKNNEFRLNFSNLTEQEIDKGIGILSEVIKEYLGK